MRIGLRRPLPNPLTLSDAGGAVSITTVRIRHSWRRLLAHTARVYGMLLNSRSGTLRPPVWKKWLRIMMLLVALVAVGEQWCWHGATMRAFEGESID